MKLAYRPELDGLKAIALIGIIFYHLPISIDGFQLFSGGFFGIDIFFVISGYLITSIILRELVLTGSFSFKNFYEKRIRRVIPTLLFVILISLPLAWFFLLPNDFIFFSISNITSLSFTSNFYHWYNGESIFQSEIIKPFLHTWSLSILVQFYFLFPIFLVIIFKYLRKYLIYILVLIFFFSFVLAHYAAKNHAGFNFYFLPTRIWEFLAGSIVAYFEITLVNLKINKRINLILSYIGLFLISYSILFLNDKILHPSIYTFIPIFGTCLIICFSQEGLIVKKILSNKLFLGIGLISYPLYLWHYPIFSFANITNFTKENLSDKFLLVIISLILSIISYYLSERFSKINNQKIFYSIIAVIYTSVFFANHNIIKNDGYNTRFSEFFDVRQKEVLRDPKSFQKCNGDVSISQTCYFNTNSNKKIFFISDSQSWNTLPYLKDIFIKKDYQFITAAHNGCSYFPGFKLKHLQETKKNYEKICNTDEYVKLLSNTKNSIIIFWSRLPLYLENSYFDNEEGGVERKGILPNKHFVSDNKNLSIEQSFKDGVSKLAKNNQIILVYPLPETGWDVRKKLLGLELTEGKGKLIEKINIPKEYLTTSYEIYKKRNESSFNLLDSFEDDNVYRVYLHKLFCNTVIQNRCLTHDDKNIFYSDPSHASPKASILIGDLILKKIEIIEISEN
ncbi:acyltransferase family protein [Candidatus Pelagibacter sp.]|nr:acyltransferase family protein [Candidatus Pelagibacter sp.]